MHQLLQRQIEKFLPPEYLENKDIMSFMEVINRSYKSFEKENKITTRAFEVSDKENIETNTILKEEIRKRDASISNLKEAIHFIKNKHQHIDEEDVLVLSNFVKNELSKRRNAESVFSSIINNIKSGILLENEKQKVLYCNNRFSCLFQLDEENGKIPGNNFIPRLLQISKLFIHPETFLKRVEQIMINKQDVASEILEMKDGRILERSYATIYNNGEFKGHFWNYCDITEKKKAEQEIVNQKQFFDEILDNIPADLAVFDKDHHYLFLNPSAIKSDATRKWIIGKTDFDYCISKGISPQIAVKRRSVFEETIQSKKEIQFVDEHPTNEGPRFILRKFFPHFEQNEFQKFCYKERNQLS